jgi:hypothetical protein
LPASRTVWVLRIPGGQLGERPRLYGAVTTPWIGGRKALYCTGLMPVALRCRAVFLRVADVTYEVNTYTVEYGPGSLHRRASTLLLDTPVPPDPKTIITAELIRGSLET